MNFWTHWEFIVTAILTPLAYWYGNRRKEKRNELLEMIDMLKEDVKYLKGEVDACRKRDLERDKLLYENLDTIEEMKRQIKRLQNDIK